MQVIFNCNDDVRLALHSALYNMGSAGVITFVVTPFVIKLYSLEDSRLLFFKYGGDMSISADISNELNYLFPDKFVVIAYVSGIKANISARGKGIKKIILKAIGGLDGATGGGHEDAVGAMVKVDDLEKFKSNLENILNHQ